MSTEKNLTGYPSIDKPWLKYYPQEMISARPSFDSILDRIKTVWQNPDETIINYYDTKIKVGEFFNRVNQVAKSLVAMDIKKGDAIVASLECVPEYLELLFACEMIGCCIKDFIADIDSTISLINRDETVCLYIAPDYIDSSDAEQIYKKTKIKNIITIDPLFSFDKNIELRKNIADVIKSKYQENTSNNPNTVSWCDFLEKGKNVDSFEKKREKSIRLISAFTSGSTGEPKELMHSTESVLGMIGQLSMAPCFTSNRELWLHTVIPPFIVSVVIAAMCNPLADGKVLALDPYCRIEDLDLEMMHYKPNGWVLVPQFVNVLIESDRVPQDYDMSHFKMFGFGAEPLSKKYIEKVQNFLDKHNYKGQLSAGYGQSEGGSGFTVAYGKEMILSGSAGIPYIDTVISIFEPKTTNELKYYEVGEICKSGAGIMIGYSDKKLTEEVLKTHPDGKLWLHTGDTGFMTPEGLLFVLGRTGLNIYPDKTVFPLAIENKVLTHRKVKEAIIVAGKDKEHNGYEALYLFVVPETEQESENLICELKEYLKTILNPEEQPKDIFVIEKKPISRFKTDRIYLQQKYILF
ncbi:MAG: acyl--CoA ligase [Clostridia bacterium]|nr:acyl--CoA ligase [Clostridia bacterium]